MTRPAYYNEHDPYAAQWIRNLIAAGLIPSGDVDERSIVDVAADDLVGYGQVHLFAGIAGWAAAARAAGWPDDRELWTGSPPCQPFSRIGKRKGEDDARHLWPHYFRLVRARRPVVLMGEQVERAAREAWLDRVLADLAGIGYAGRACVVPACAVDGPHRRDRIWFVAELDEYLTDLYRARAMGDGERAGLERHAEHDDHEARRAIEGGSIAAASVRGAGRVVVDADVALAEEWRKPCGGEFEGAGRDSGVHSRFDPSLSAWADSAWVVGHDGKARRTKPGLRLLADGVPSRMGRLRAYGNAIVPQVAAEVIGAYMDCAPR
jgi:DNA (cytosine-5)-methyltransferase 1